MGRTKNKGKTTEENVDKDKISKNSTIKGHTTRYSCLYSTVPDKRRAPPRV